MANKSTMTSVVRHSAKRSHFQLRLCFDVALSLSNRQDLRRRNKWRRAAGGVHTRGRATALLLSEDRDMNRDQKIARENIVVKVTKRRRGMKLTGRDPSVRISPLPAYRGDVLN